MFLCNYLITLKRIRETQDNENVKDYKEYTSMTKSKIRNFSLNAFVFS